MTHFDPTKNKVFFGNTDKLADWIAESIEQAKVIDKIKLIMIFWFIPILISGSLGLISSQYLFPKYQSGEIMGATET